jgi:DNA-binding transcriptional ArsR family regulator
MEREMKTAKAFKALGDPTRLRIVQFLACCPKTVLVDDKGGVEGPTAGEICCQITGAEKITSTISHHLHELKGSGLVDIERRGKKMVCSLNRKAVRELGEFVLSLDQGDNDECC